MTDPKKHRFYREANSQVMKARSELGVAARAAGIARKAEAGPDVQWDADEEVLAARYALAYAKAWRELVPAMLLGASQATLKAWFMDDMENISDGLEAESAREGEVL